MVGSVPWTLGLRPVAALAILAAAMPLGGCGDDEASGGGTGGVGAAGGGGTGGAGAAGGGGSVLPGGPCAEPPQAPLGTDWPEVFVGTEGCDDGGAGTRQAPFCTFPAAFAAVPEAPAIVTVLEGEYRLVDQYDAGSFGFELTRPGTADEYFVIRADDGARPMLLGSVSIDGSTFENTGGGIFRAPADGLGRDPAAIWTVSGTRIEHHHGTFNQDYHVDTTELAAGEWTKADAGGVHCGDDSAGCFIYLHPPAGMNVADEQFEVGQGGFLRSSGSDYLVLQGLTFRYTHWTPVFLSGGSHFLVEDNDFAHNAAQGGNNAYGLALWGTSGAVIRNNRVVDTRYWTSVNAWGITFMLAEDGPDGDIWVCGNTIEDFSGQAVGSKGGASHVHVVGNWIRNASTGVEVPASRCDGTAACTKRFEGGAWHVAENVIEDCRRCFDVAHISDYPELVRPNVVHNNLFACTTEQIAVQQGDPALLVRNNVFLGDAEAIRLGGVADANALIAAGFDSDFNFFVGPSAYVAYQNFALQGSWSLTEVQATFGAEASSLSGEPELDASDDYRPLSGSPVLGAGDPSVYPDATGAVNMGPHPF